MKDECKNGSPHTHRYFLSLFQQDTQLQVQTQPKIFQECDSSKISKCLITHPSSTICCRIHQQPVRFLQDRSSDFRYNLRSCARRLFVSALCVCVCVFPYFLKSENLPPRSDSYKGHLLKKKRQSRQIKKKKIAIFIQ